MMRVLLLGPFEVEAESGKVCVSAPKQRALLAALALEANREVATSRLLTLLWREPPATARSALQGHVAALRKVLGAESAGGLRVVTGTSGYRLVDPDERVDFHRFQALCAEAADRTDAVAVSLLQRALGLWRGVALEGCGSDRLQETARPLLEEARLSALEALAERLLRLSRGEEAIHVLRDAVRSHPLREPLVAAVMRCYQQSGDNNAAIALFEDTRRRLTDALGVEPGPALQAAHHALHTTRPPQTAPAPSQPRSAPAPAPAMLPRPGRGFVGRSRELAWLEAQADEDESAPILLSGPAGVGKTNLALYWAHQYPDRFPDGHLYVNLRGFDESEPVDPATALAGFLRALGIPDDAIPVDGDERASRYRTLLAGRRCLVLLDNARSYDQVRPLLPDGPGPIAVVTSRDRLGDLVVHASARPVTLTPLLPGEAHELLAYVIPPFRLAAEPEAVEQIIAACDHLPLALRIIAARLASHPTWPLAQMAKELADEQARLGILSTSGGLAVSGALHLTCRTLPMETVQVFSLLALHPGPDIDLYAAAALAKLTLAQAHVHLAELHTAHLIEEPTPGRYALHDLVRLYARELATQLPEKDRDSAFGRLLDQYLAAVFQASAAIHGPILPEQPAEAPAGALPVLATPADVGVWFHREEPTIRALIGAAAQQGRTGVALRLSWQAGDMYYTGGHLQEWVKAAQVGLNAAERAGNALGQAALHSDLGTALMYQGRFLAALEHMERSVTLCEIAEHAGPTRRRCLARLANCLIEVGQPERAVVIQEGLVNTAERLNDAGLTAKALNNLAHALIRAEQPLVALTHAERAVAVVMGNSHLIYPYLIYALQTSAEALHALGRYYEALDCSTRALELAREGGGVNIQALCTEFIGEILQRLGRHVEAAAHWRDAIELYSEQGRPVDELKNRLAAIEAEMGARALSSAQ